MRNLITTMLLCVTSLAFARDVTVYRTILAEADYRYALEAALTADREIAAYRGKFVLVSGWYDHFDGALPENPSETQWNQRWKHVYPVELSIDEAQAKGLRFPALKTERLNAQMGAADYSSAARDQRSLRIQQLIESVREAEQREEATTQELVDMLQPNYESLIAQANDSRRGPEAETAQLWLAKSYYLEGLVHSKERLPQTQGNHLRHASPEEEIAYLSALAEYERFLERFPNSEHREEAAYHVAAVHYHLTYRGHHRHQVEKAIQAYQDFIDDYPESEKVPRAYLNLLGMSLEIARMDGEGFDRVIDNYKTLMANYPDANDYVALRAKLIAAEAYYEGKKDYDQVFALCNELLDEPGTLQMPGVFGNAIKLRGLTNVVVDNLAESVLDFTLLIDFYQNSEFHFNYKVRQSLACAYFYRGFSSMVMGRTQKAIGDFQKVIDDFEDTQYFVDAEKILDRLSQ